MDKVAFLFPGQGSQKVGMGSSFATDPKVTALYETANETMGIDLKELMIEGSEDLLSQTSIAQPAIFVDSNARYRLLIEEGIKPDCVLGHSLGEFSALGAAGCIDFEQGVRLVKKRGELMEDINVEGTMVAVLGLDYTEAEKLIREIGESVTLANYNSPEQLVLSGREEPLDKACQYLQEEGARCIELDVSGPFHSPFMEEAERKLKDYINKLDFEDPEVPVLSGVSGSFETNGDGLADLLGQQMTHPVKWVDYVRTLGDFGVDITIEAGPDATLTKLTRRILPDIECKTFDEVM
ncbi:MAG: ACP S-malonyltransferase [Candidatus Bipolaricaulota bacterium]